MSFQADSYQLRFAANRFTAGSQEFRRQADLVRGKASGWSGQGADSFLHACDRLHTDLCKASDALERTAGALLTLSYRVEHIEQLRSQAQSVEWEAWGVEDSTEEGQQRYSHLMSRAHSLRRQADEEARSADAQAAAAFAEISASSSLLAVATLRGNAGTIVQETEAWDRYYQKQQRQYDEEDHTAYVPMTPGQAKRWDEEQSAEFVAQTNGSSFWDKVQMVMAGGVDGTKELALEFVHAIGHPWETAKSFVYMVTHPEEAIDAIVETGERLKEDWDKGNAYGVSKTLTQVTWTVVGLKNVGLSEDAADAASNAVKSGFDKWGPAQRVVQLSDGTIIRIPESVWKSNEQLAEYLETRIVNSRLAGDQHPVTDVPFDLDGFPIFDAKAEIELPENLYMANDKTQFKYANKQVAQMIESDPNLKAQFNEEELDQFAHGDTPLRFTWHHHQLTGKLQLVDSEIHQKTGHTGGRAIWGGGSQYR